MSLKLRATISMTRFRDQRGIIRTGFQNDGSAAVQSAVTGKKPCTWKYPPVKPADDTAAIDSIQAHFPFPQIGQI
jgi:hypothetical protein